jgi:hypothetical protein
MGLGLIYMVADLDTLKDEQDTHFYVEDALSRCVKRHANLRAHIVEEEGRGKDICLEVVPFDELPAAFCKVPLVKLDGESKTVLSFTQELLCENVVAAGGPDSPLWQLVLVEEEEKEGGKKKQHLVVLAHHSIMDGESVLLFLKEVVENMNATAAAAAAATAAVTAATTAAAARSARNKVETNFAAAPAWAASMSISPTPGSTSTSALATATEPEPLPFLSSSQDELFETVLPPTAGEGTFGCGGLAFLWKRITW